MSGAYCRCFQVDSGVYCSVCLHCGREKLAFVAVWEVGVHKRRVELKPDDSAVDDVTYSDMEGTGSRCGWDPIAGLWSAQTQIFVQSPPYSYVFTMNGGSVINVKKANGICAFGGHGAATRPGLQEEGEEESGPKLWPQ
ncbi:hypothetical protein JOB18_012167 [Solea senegalensis]|uniref:Uncharacterized protein n=1 Tax=Solea senegalensis TaxID=28829 RepID=A0AAV6R9X7_SOLSE|nr:hypothetical protein JOB18_012167 [Solea senegalensis]